MDPFMELFSDEVMCMFCLYSTLPETGVPNHIGTGAVDAGAKFVGLEQSLAFTQKRNTRRPIPYSYTSPRDTISYSRRRAKRNCRCSSN